MGVGGAAGYTGLSRSHGGRNKVRRSWGPPWPRSSSRQPPSSRLWLGSVERDAEVGGGHVTLTSLFPPDPGPAVTFVLLHETKVLALGHGDGALAGPCHGGGGRLSSAFVNSGRASTDTTPPVTTTAADGAPPSCAHLQSGRWLRSGLWGTRAPLQNPHQTPCRWGPPDPPLREALQSWLGRAKQLRAGLVDPGQAHTDLPTHLSLLS